MLEAWLCFIEVNDYSIETTSDIHMFCFDSNARILSLVEDGECFYFENIFRYNKFSVKF